MKSSSAGTHGSSTALFPVLALGGKFRNIALVLRCGGAHDVVLTPHPLSRPSALHPAGAAAPRGLAGSQQTGGKHAAALRNGEFTAQWWFLFVRLLFGFFFFFSCCGISGDSLEGTPEHMKIK